MTTLDTIESGYFEIKIFSGCIFLSRINLTLKAVWVLKTKDDIFNLLCCIRVLIQALIRVNKLTQNVT